jgi:hypothetical protein
MNSDSAIPATAAALPIVTPPPLLLPHRATMDQFQSRHHVLATPMFATTTTPTPPVNTDAAITTTTSTHVTPLRQLTCVPVTYPAFVCSRQQPLPQPPSLLESSPFSPPVSQRLQPPLVVTLSPLWKLSDSDTLNAVLSVVRAHRDLPSNCALSDVTALAWWRSSLVGRMSQSNFHLRICRLLEEGRLFHTTMITQLVARMLVGMTTSPSFPAFVTTGAVTSLPKTATTLSPLSHNKRKRARAAVSDVVVVDDEEAADIMPPPPPAKRTCPMANASPR